MKYCYQKKSIKGFLRCCFQIFLCKIFKTKAVAQRCSVKKEACNFIKKETLAQVIFCEFCKISKNTFSYRTPLVAASVKKQWNNVIYFFIWCSGFRRECGIYNVLYIISLLQNSDPTQELTDSLFPQVLEYIYQVFFVTKSEKYFFLEPATQCTHNPNWMFIICLTPRALNMNVLFTIILGFASTMNFSRNYK